MIGLGHGDSPGPGGSFRLRPRPERSLEFTGPAVLRARLGRADAPGAGTFLRDLSGVLVALAALRAGDLAAKHGPAGALDRIAEASIDGLRRNLDPPLAPWRSNRNDWLSDFAAHPAMGFALASTFRDRGHGPLASYAGAVLADAAWEFVLEGAHAPVEWNDLLTTSLLGAALGAFAKPAPGAYTLRPVGILRPGSGGPEAGLRVTQPLRRGAAFSLSATARRGEMTVLGEVSFGRVEVHAGTTARLWKRRGRAIGAGVRVTL